MVLSSMNEDELSFGAAGGQQDGDNDPEEQETNGRDNGNPSATDAANPEVAVAAEATKSDYSSSSDRWFLSGGLETANSNANTNTRIDTNPTSPARTTNQEEALLQQEQPNCSTNPSSILSDEDDDDDDDDEFSISICKHDDDDNDDEYYGTLILDGSASWMKEQQRQQQQQQVSDDDDEEREEEVLKTSGGNNNQEDFPIDISDLSIPGTDSLPTSIGIDTMDYAFYTHNNNNNNNNNDDSPLEPSTQQQQQQHHRQSSSFILLVGISVLTITSCITSCVLWYHVKFWKFSNKHLQNEIQRLRQEKEELQDLLFEWNSQNGNTTGFTMIDNCWIKANVELGACGDDTKDYLMKRFSSIKHIMESLFGLSSNHHSTTSTIASAGAQAVLAGVAKAMLEEVANDNGTNNNDNNNMVEKQDVTQTKEESYDEEDSWIGISNTVLGTMLSSVISNNEQEGDKEQAIGNEKDATEDTFQKDSTKLFEQWSDAWQDVKWRDTLSSISDSVVSSFVTELLQNENTDNDDSAISKSDNEKQSSSSSLLSKSLASSYKDLERKVSSLLSQVYEETLLSTSTSNALFANTNLNELSSLQNHQDMLWTYLVNAVRTTVKEQEQDSKETGSSSTFNNNSNNNPYKGMKDIVDILGRVKEKKAFEKEAGVCFFLSKDEKICF